MRARLLAGLVVLIAQAAVAAEPARPDPDLTPKPDDTEPVACFKVAWNNEADGGFGLTMGQAVELCGGTHNARATLKCFAQAYEHPANGGLGLTAGHALRLCKTHPTPQQ